jgi:endoglucanase
MSQHLVLERWRELAPEIKRLSHEYNLELLAMEQPSQDPAKMELAFQAAADDVQVDALGNVLVTKKGRGARRTRVMVDAHMDEVGFMLVAESGEGLYEFAKIGNIDARGVAGKQVVVGSKRTPGVIGTKAIHLLSEEDLKRPISMDALRVDLGPGGKANLGDRGSFAPKFRRAGPSVMSKSWTTAWGSILIILKHACVGTAGSLHGAEEIGLRGEVAANYLRPTWQSWMPRRPTTTPAAGRNTFQFEAGLAGVYVSTARVDDPRLVRAG